MSSRRSSLEKRCPRCRIQKKLCFCGHLEELENHTAVSIIMHVREGFLTTNTATLTRLVLKNTQILMRGSPSDPLDLAPLLAPAFQEKKPEPKPEAKPEQKPRTFLYLYPEEGAQVLDQEFCRNHPGPYHLIVPDGSWRQARKFRKRELLLKELPAVKLPQGKPSRYYLRHHHKEESLCTFEAIARALGILENPDLQMKMETMLDVMVARVLKSRTDPHTDLPTNLPTNLHKNNPSGVHIINSRDQQNLPLVDFFP